jgi:Fe-S-cluster-containing dehydrogenase component/DMSO reductase anchor subunit
LLLQVNKWKLEVVAMDTLAIAHEERSRFAQPFCRTEKDLAIAASKDNGSEAGERAMLLKRLLREQGDPTIVDQQQLSAVEVFSKYHDQHQRDLSLRANRYRDLLPAAPPQSGQQYAFEVDLDRCSGCKACVTACHSLNGLDETETWRDVGLLIGGTSALPVLQHVTAACHHCLQPACLQACPVNAYEKDPVTGIVKHLDDQCFGCQYCTLACPYEVPKYHPGKGIVRKCDMCSARLAEGEAPACVQACPHQAISIKTVDIRQIVEDTEASNFLPAAPDPHITQPTTTYKTCKPFPRNMLPADYFRIDKQHTHWPLVVMLVLTQLSVGAFVVGMILEVILDVPLAAAIRPLLAVNALGFGLLALSASVFHLGRPFYAFRAVLGLWHSWLSREIVAFGIFAGLASVYAATIFMASMGGNDRTDFFSATAAAVIRLLTSSIRWLGWSVAIVGCVAVFCSIMIYVFTQRECWSFLRVTMRFILTAALLGVAVVWLTILGLTITSPSVALKELVYRYGPPLCGLLMLLSTSKLLWEAAIFRHLLLSRMTPLKRSALLMTRELSNITLARFAAGILGGLVMPGFLLVSLASAANAVNLPQFVVITSMLFVACLVGELLERVLFFTACAAPRMPGGIR